MRRTAALLGARQREQRVQRSSNARNSSASVGSIFGFAFWPERRCKADRRPKKAIARYGRGRDEDFSSPPAQIPAKMLTHRAPPAGSGVEAVTRQRVYSSDWRKEAGDELDEPLPAEACRLAASLERCEPEPLHLVEEPPQARWLCPQ